MIDSKYNKKHPFISIIIPTRNEEYHLERCLGSLVSNDYPKSRQELFIVDGGSSDNTINISKKYKTKFPFFQILANKKKIFPAAINLGIRESKGEIIIVLGAHATYNKNYISNCVKYSLLYEVDNVGGYIKTIWPGNTSIIGDNIILALSSPFGVGGSTFRSKNSKSETVYVDTVFGGCYKKSIFKEIGLFNENFIFSSDIEFNYRLRKNGGKILFVPTIESSYYYSKSRIKFLAFMKHNLRNGYWSIYPLQFIKYNPFSLRHYIPLLFVLGLFSTLLLSLMFHAIFYAHVGILLSYFIVNGIFTWLAHPKKLSYYLILPFIFFSIHLSYGISSLWGLITIIAKKLLIQPQNGK
jgi:glycosyltransferase involved in cell wall biosynthesis